MVESTVAQESLQFWSGLAVSILNSNRSFRIKATDCVRKLRQLSTNPRLVSCSHSEFLAIRKTVFVVFNSWSADLAFSHSAISSCHVPVALGRLQKLYCGNFRLFLLGLLEFFLPRNGFKVVFKSTAWRVMFSRFVVLGDRLLIFFALNKSLVGQVVVRWRVLHLAVKRGVAVVLPKFIII